MFFQLIPGFFPGLTTIFPVEIQSLPGVNNCFPEVFLGFSHGFYVESPKKACFIVGMFSEAWVFLLRFHRWITFLTYLAYIETSVKARSYPLSSKRLLI